MVGGLANCPACGKAAAVEGLRDPLWRIWKTATFVAAIAVAYATSQTAGTGWGLAALVVGMLLAWLISRGF